MWWTSKAEAIAYKIAQEMDIPVLKKRLKVVQDTATTWDRYTGEPNKRLVWTVVTK